MEHQEFGDITRLADKKAQHLIQFALHRLSLPTTSNHASTNIRPITTTNSLLPMNANGTISLRYRSSSSSTHDKKSVLNNNSPTRYSIPATKSDFVKFQSRFLANAIYTTNNHSIMNNSKNNLVQYSYSLNKPWLPKLDRNRHLLLSIQNFVSELIDQCMRAAFVQIDYIHLSETSSMNTNDVEENLASSILLFDCYPPFISAERLNTIQSFADQLLSSCFQQSYDSMEQYSSPHHKDKLLRTLSNRVVENVLNEAIESIKYENKFRKKRNNRMDNEKCSASLMTDDEKIVREAKKVTLSSDEEDNDDEMTKRKSLFVKQIRHRSSSAFKALKTKKEIKTNNENDEQYQSTLNLVTAVTKQIYDDTFNELKRIYMEENETV